MSYGGLIIFAAFFIFTYVLCFWPDDGTSFIQNPCRMVFNESSEAGCSNPSFQVTCENNKSVMNFNYGEHQAEAIIASNPSSSSSSFR